MEKQDERKRRKLREYLDILRQVFCIRARLKTNHFSTQMIFLK